MKNLNLSIFLSIMAIFGLYGCSNDKVALDDLTEETVTIRATTNISEMPEDVQKIIQERQPSIPQGILDFISSLNSTVSEFELADWKPELIEKNTDSGSEILQTRAGTLSFTGYTNAWRIFSPIEITLSDYNTSGFRQCIEMGSGAPFYDHTRFTVNFYSFEQDLWFFDDVVTNVYALASDRDIIGFDPFYFPVRIEEKRDAGGNIYYDYFPQISNSTTLRYGFVVEGSEKYPGLLWTATTYVISIIQHDATAGYAYLFPYGGGGVANYKRVSFGIDGLAAIGNKLKWSVMWR